MRALVSVHIHRLPLGNVGDQTGPSRPGPPQELLQDGVREGLQSLGRDVVPVFFQDRIQRILTKLFGTILSLPQKLAFTHSLVAQSSLHHIHH